MQQTEEFLKGFAEARRLAEQCVQQARSGEADRDFRSIAYRIRNLSPGDELTLDA